MDGKIDSLSYGQLIRVGISCDKVLNKSNEIGFTFHLVFEAKPTSHHEICSNRSYRLKQAEVHLLRTML